MTNDAIAPTKCLVVLPTYNEHANIPELVNALIVQNENCTVQVLVVDDQSPDGTGELALELSKENECVHVIVRSNVRGLGSATVTGMRWGLERDFSLIATMDADHSHDPQQVTAMLARMLTDHSATDLLIGSRYVAGGAIQGWPFHRRIMSRVLNCFVRIWLGLKPRDNSGACRVYRAEALRDIKVESIRSIGYGYLEELILLFQQAGKSIGEHPITFRDRKHGSSKLNIRQSLQAVWQIIQLRFK